MCGHRTACLSIVLLLLGATTAPVVGLTTSDSASGDTASGPAQTSAQLDANATPTRNEQSNVSPGEHLSGVLGVQEAELNGTIESRTLGISVAIATSNASKAAVMKDQLVRIEHRLERLREERRALEDAYETDRISAGQYRARTAIIVAQIRSVRALTNESETLVLDLPSETREEHGIDDTAIRNLNRNASTLTGRDVAGVARSIAGENAGRPVPRGPPSDRDVSRADRSSSDNRGPPDAPRTPPTDRGGGLPVTPDAPGTPED